MYAQDIKVGISRVVLGSGGKQWPVAKWMFAVASTSTFTQVLVSGGEKLASSPNAFWDDASVVSVAIGIW